MGKARIRRPVGLGLQVAGKLIPIHPGAQAQIDAGQASGLFKKLLGGCHIHHRGGLPGTGYGARHAQGMKRESLLQLQRVRAGLGLRRRV